MNRRGLRIAGCPSPKVRSKTTRFAATPAHRPPHLRQAGIAEVKEAGVFAGRVLLLVFADQLEGEFVHGGFVSLGT